MILTSCVSESNTMPTEMTGIETSFINDCTYASDVSSDLMPTEDIFSSTGPTKISIVSSEPILASSSKFILLNEVTKKKNHFVLVDEHFQCSTIRSPIKTTLLDALWYDNQQQFLILTSTNVFALDPNTRRIEIIKELIPIDNHLFKCFTLLNQSTLFIAYNEWGGKYIDRWQPNMTTGHWELVERQSLQLTPNEVIGNILTITEEDDCLMLAMTIYNILTEEWRIELRHIETLEYRKAILLPGSNLMHDYKLISTEKTTSGIKWLVCSTINSIIIAMDGKWKKILLNYKNPVQQIVVHKTNYLLVRTRDKLDIHMFT